MNLIDALTEHNQIARQTWPPCEFVLVDGNTLVHVIHGRIQSAGWNPSMSDALADDWRGVDYGRPYRVTRDRGPERESPASLQGALCSHLGEVLTEG